MIRNPDKQGACLKPLCRTAVVANAEEELLLSVVEKVALKPCEASSAYEDIVISHSTAIQNDRNLVHQDFRLV